MSHNLRLTIRTSNIVYLHQDDLVDKLKIATDYRFNDKTAERMVLEEIEKRKMEGKWIYDK